MVVETGTENVDRVLNPTLPGRHEAVQVRAADQDSGGTEGNGGSDIGALTYPTVEKYRRVRTDGVKHWPERVERCDGPVELAAPVVRDDNTVGAEVNRPARELWIE